MVQKKTLTILMEVDIFFGQTGPVLRLPVCLQKEVRRS